MNERDFCFWLWGFMELNYTDSPTVDQWKCIKAHLATVFDKKAPDVNIEHQVNFTNGNHIALLSAIEKSIATAKRRNN